MPCEMWPHALSWEQTVDLDTNEETVILGVHGKIGVPLQFGPSQLSLQAHNFESLGRCERSSPSARLPQTVDGRFDWSSSGVEG